MRAIMIMFDSLRRDALQAYGGGLHLPNFQRLARHTVAFDNSYVSSLPCMPARRELHTGRPCFLHRNWGPLEPFDVSMPELLKKAGIHSRLATDHYHYLEDGGATYHGRYSTWACYRGQESDTWIGDCSPKPEGFAPIMMSQEQQAPNLQAIRKQSGWQNLANRSVRKDEGDWSQTQTFDDGIDFIDRNAAWDNWFLQIEAFDPHEPFDSPDSFLSQWFDPDRDFAMDWPPYALATEDAATIENMRKKYYALVHFCDKSLGRVLDAMDRHDLWKDTMLIVNTDHGFSLGEHDWWAKNNVPDYQEVAHTPLFIWDPRTPVMGEHRQALVQTIDLAPTILDFFGLPIPETMMGKPLAPALRDDSPVHEYGIFGMFGSVLSITDGRYAYMRAVQTPDEPIDEYTFMPTRMRGFFSPEELRGAQMCEGFSFTHGPVMRIPCITKRVGNLTENLLYDVVHDPKQQSPLNDPQTEARMTRALAAMMHANEAPPGLYRRYGLDETQEM